MCKESRSLPHSTKHEKIKRERKCGKKKFTALKRGRPANRHNNNSNSTHTHSIYYTMYTRDCVPTGRQTEPTMIIQPTLNSDKNARMLYQYSYIYIIYINIIIIIAIMVYIGRTWNVIKKIVATNEILFGCWLRVIYIIK